MIFPEAQSDVMQEILADCSDSLFRYTVETIIAVIAIYRQHMTQKSEDIRLRYFYRNLILQGKARISLESARRLVGPDCAFHLYGVAGLKKKRGKK